MSCGGLHAPGEALNLHIPRDHHGDDPGPGGPPWPRSDWPGEPRDDPPGGGQPETGGPPAPAQEQAPRHIKTAAAGAWAEHRHLVTPFIWPAGVDGAALLAHQMATAGVFGLNRPDALFAALSAGTVAEVVTEFVNHHRQRRPRWRKLTRVQIAAGTAWSMGAAAWTPVGWQDIVQWLALAGGLVLGGIFAYEKHQGRRPARAAIEPPGPAWTPPAIATPAPVDPRLRAFIDRFCQPGGELDEVTPRNCRDLPRGFMFEVLFPVHTRHSMADVESLRVLIAKLYGVTRDDVAVGYTPDDRSEGLCQVVVQTRPVLTAAERENPEYNRWDGESTWDPATGLIALGRYLDDTIAHYAMNEPYSGARAGMVAGVMGAGKTGTMHVIAAEAGLARLCSRCGGRHACGGQCDRRRVMAVWLGDPQKQPFGVWRGRADLMGWGVPGCVHLLQFAEHTAGRRVDVLSNVRWHDTHPVTGQRRLNIGKGWFDPEPGFPLIFLGVDELPKIVKYPDQDLAKYALGIIVDGILEWRKLGIHLLIGTQMLDVSQIGVREIRDMLRYLNSIAHRVDEVSGDMGGITGDPRELPANEPGAGFIAGPDERPGDRFTTKNMPESLKPGQRGLDIRHLAEVIGSTPIYYDPGTLAAMDQFGVVHQQVFTEFEYSGGPARPEADAAPGSPPAGGPDAAGLLGGEQAGKILAALSGSPGLSLYGLMQRSGLSMGEAMGSLEELTAAGRVIKTAEDQYAAA
jgi:hypothetical protein